MSEICRLREEGRRKGSSCVVEKSAGGWEDGRVYRGGEGGEGVEGRECGGRDGGKEERGLELEGEGLVASGSECRGQRRGKRRG